MKVVGTSRALMAKTEDCGTVVRPELKWGNMHVRQAGLVKLSKQLPQSVQSREGAEKADTVADRGKGTGGAV